MPLFLIAPQHGFLRGSDKYSGVLINAADLAAARTAAIASAAALASPGSLGVPTSPIRFWSSLQVSATDGALPGGASALWLDGSSPLFEAGT